LLLLRQPHFSCGARNVRPPKLREATLPALHFCLHEREHPVCLVGVCEKCDLLKQHVYDTSYLHAVTLSQAKPKSNMSALIDPGLRLLLQGNPALQGTEMAMLNPFQLLQIPLAEIATKSSTFWLGVLYVE